MYIMFLLLVLAFPWHCPAWAADALDSWAVRASNTSAYGGVGYGSGRFIAVGDFGAVLTSPTGVTWTDQTSGTSDYLSGAAYGNGVFVAAGDAGTVVTSSDGVTWTDRTSGTSNYLSGVGYGNGVFVIVGGLGAVLTSPDGMTWTARTSGTSRDLYGVAFGNGVFVATGDAGAVVTSSDGATWTVRASGTSEYLWGVSYGSGSFVAVGDFGTILTSSDNGITWVTQTSGTAGDLYGIAYGNGTFTAVGGDWSLFTGVILTSPDSTTWTSRAAAASLDPLLATAYGNNTFVALSAAGAIVQSGALTSLNALTVDRTGAGTVTSNPAGIACGADCLESYPAGATVTLTATPDPGASFVGWSGGGCTGNNATCAVTLDANKTVSAAFTVLTGPPSGSVIINNGAASTASFLVDLALSATASGAITEMQFSNDNVNWSVPEPYGTTKQLWELSAGDGIKTVYAKFKDNLGFWSDAAVDTIILDTIPPVVTAQPAGGAYVAAMGVQPVALSANEAATIYYTLDNSQPTSASPVYSQPLPVSGEAALKFFAVDQAGNVGDIRTELYQISPLPVGDPLDAWHVRATSTSADGGIGYGNGIFMAVGGSGTILTSADNGGVWTPRTSQTGKFLAGAAYGNGIFVAVGEEGTVVTSADGVTWTKRNSATSSNLAGIAHGNGTFVAVGEAGAVVTSADGMTWTSRTAITAEYLAGVAYGGGIFAVVGGVGTLLTSADNGVTWTARTSGTSEYLWGVSYGSGSFVAVGDFGTILTSANGANWVVQPAVTDDDLYGIAYGNGIFTAVGGNWNSYTGAVVTSPDGMTWTSRASAASLEPLYSVAYGNNTFVVLSATGTISQSDSLPVRYTVTLGRTGAGTVTSAPPGLACGVDCIENYLAGATVTLTAQPDAGASFIGWSGGGCVGADPTCTFTLDADKTITAAFTADTTGPSGTVTINGGAPATAGALVDLTLSAADASGVTEMQFSSDNVNWSAPEPYSTQAMWTLSAGDGLKTVYVKFMDNLGFWSAAASDTIVLDTAAPVVAAQPTGGIYVAYLGVQPVTLSANEAATIYYTLDGSIPTDGSAVYGGPISATDANPTTIRYFAVDPAGNVSEAKTELYEIISGFTLTVSKEGDGAGTITSDRPGINCPADCVENFAVGQQVVLTATPAAYHGFLGWSGGSCSGTGACVVSMTDQQNIAALFSAPLKGDINNDQRVDMLDALIYLRALDRNPVGVRSDYVPSETDPSGDGKIGLQDVIFIIQKIGGLR